MKRISIGRVVVRVLSQYGVEAIERYSKDNNRWNEPEVPNNQERPKDNSASKRTPEQIIVFQQLITKEKVLLEDRKVYFLRLEPFEWTFSLFEIQKAI
jgi:hypothetical protein